MENAVASLKDALAGTNVEAIKNATEKLMGVSQTFSQRLYEQASQAQSAPSADGSGSAGDGSDDEVVDAEIVDEQ